MKCFEKCIYLTNITIPINETRVIYGNKIFTIPHFKQTFYLPPKVTIINGKEIEKLTSLTIPSHVTSVDEICFKNCNELKELILPETLVNIPHLSLMNNPELEELRISPQYELHEDRLFIIKDKCLESIQLPITIKKINGKEIKLYDLTSYTIPTNVTKLNDYCFSNCQELTEIKGIEEIKEYGKGCFINCPKLNKEEYPQVKQNNEEYLNEKIKEKDQKQLEEWTGLKCSDILFDSVIDNWSEYTSVLNDRIIGKKQLVFLIEDDDGEKFGYYLNTEVIENYDEDEWTETDNRTFHFNLESKDNRLSKPMKFEITDPQKGGCYLSEKSHECLIVLGDITLHKENKKNESCCDQDEDNFDYHGIEKALCGKEYFIPQKILVIQMK